MSSQQPRWSWTLAIAVWGFASLASCQEYDPIKNWCMRWFQQSTVKKDNLYVDGGLQTFSYPNSSAPYPLGYNKLLIQVPLTDSWDWKVNISQIAVAKTNDTKSNDVLPPSLYHGAVFKGWDQSDQIFTYGGTYFQSNATFGNPTPDSPAQGLWSFARGSNSWTRYDVSGGTAVRPSYGAYADASDQGLGFYLSGQLDSASQPNTSGFGTATEGVTGMIVFNFTGSTPTARNISTSAVIDNAIIGGSLSYVANIANHGILVALGGLFKSTGVGIENGTLNSFDTVDVFDIASIYNGGNGAWYKQKTSGKSPEPRTDYCTVVASAIDNSSHNIYVYSGRNPLTGILFDDVYILSIPSFTWVKVYSGTSPRWGHSCHLVAKRQMLTVGGHTSNNITGVCDWHTAGVGVMEMTTKIWGSKYNAYAASYEVPGDVVDKIGGSPRGGAKVQTPVNGWGAPGLNALFTGAKAGTTNPPSSPGSSNPTSSNTPEAPKKVAPGAIAGAVIGSLAFLALIGAAVLFFCLRRKRASVSPDDEQPPEYSAEAPELQGFTAPAVGSAKATAEVYELPVDEPKVEMETGSEPTVTERTVSRPESRVSGREVEARGTNEQ